VTDAFAAINDLSIPELWAILGLPGEPKPHGAMRSPFREDRSPSFSLFADGRAWKDHATGDGGDAVEFARHALGTDHAGVRTWWIERSGIERQGPLSERSSLWRSASRDGSSLRSPAAHHQTARRATPASASPPAAIHFPAELVEGTEETWHAFATRRGIPVTAVSLAVRHGLLRFCRIHGKACYVVTDAARRCAEIRRWDGSRFIAGKAYPLKGVDKSWLAGCELLEREPQQTAVLLVEGCTDFLSALGLYLTYRQTGGIASWVTLGLFGAGCKRLAPDAAALMRGRYVRLVPDGDDAGDTMRAHWTAMLRALGCTVDSVTLPRGSDLTDHYAAIHPHQLFSRSHEA
jgi:hypothetical protein